MSCVQEGRIPPQTFLETEQDGLSFRMKVPSMGYGNLRTVSLFGNLGVFDWLTEKLAYRTVCAQSTSHSLGELSELFPEVRS